RRPRNVMCKTRQPRRQVVTVQWLCFPRGDLAEAAGATEHVVLAPVFTLPGRPDRWPRNVALNNDDQPTGLGLRQEGSRSFWMDVTTPVAIYRGNVRSVESTR